MPKTIYLLLIVCLHSFIINAQKLDDVWKTLHQNQRSEALQMVNQKKFSKDDLEHTLLKKIIESENGMLEFDIDFIKTMSDYDEFEPYLFALWEETYFFDAYYENGFSEKHFEIFDQIDFSSVKNSTLKSALSYLNGVVDRHHKDWNGFSENLNTINTLRDWEYCGVFENLNMSGLAIPYPPEEEPNLNVQFDAQGNGATQWYKNNYAPEVYNVFINHQEYGEGVHYAQTFIESDITQTVVLKLGRSGLIKVWINDALIIEENQPYITELDAHTFKVKLNEGVNRILVKVASGSENPYFIIRLEDTEGKPLNTIKSNLDQRDYKKEKRPVDLATETGHFAESFFENRLKNNIGNEGINRLCLFNTYLRNGKMESAYSVLEPWYDANPDSSFLRILLITYFSDIGDANSIAKLKENIVRIDPDYYVSLMYTYENFDELMKLDIQEYKTTLEKLGGAVDLSYMKAITRLLIALRDNNFTDMRTELDGMLTDKAIPSKIHATFSEFYTKVFNDDNATIEVLENFNEQYFNWDVQTYLAYYYNKQNRFEDALKVYTDLLEYNAADNNYQYNIVEMLHESFQFERSLPYIDQALKNMPNSYLFLKFKADAYLQLKKKDKAIAMYKEALSKRPSDKTLRYRINDLNNFVNPLNTYKIEDFYAYAETHKNTISSNNYGLNTLLSQTNILDLDNGGGGMYNSTFIYEITSQNGINIFKEYNLNLSGDYTISKSEIVKPDGTIIPADRNGSILVFDEIEIGDVILIDYDASYRRSGRFYKDHILSRNFTGYHPVINHVYRFITESKTIPFTVTNGTLDYKVSKKDGYFVHEWSNKNSEGVPISEDYMPPFSDVVTKLHISTIESWNAIANWYSDLVRHQLQKDNTVISVYNELFPEGHQHLSETKRAEIIYYYIMDNFNYSHISFRQSGYVPQKPSKTIKSKLGDCKDLSSLFLVLGQMTDLKSNLILILTSDYGAYDLVLPSTDFNHCIVKVNLDGEDYFLELTDKNLPFKSLPMSLRMATALDIPFETSTQQNSNLYKLVSNNRAQSLFGHDTKLVITDSTATADVTTKVSGHLSSYYVGTYKESEDELLEETLFTDLSNRTTETVELMTFNGVDYDRSKGEISFGAKLKMDLDVNKIGEYYAFKVPKFVHPYNEDIIQLVSRNYPIDYKQYENSDTYAEAIEIQIDDKYQFVNLPESQEFTYKAHQFSIGYELLQPNLLKVAVSSRVNSNDISPEDYSGYKAYVKKVLETTETMVTYKLAE